MEKDNKKEIYKKKKRFGYGNREKVQDKRVARELRTV